MHPAVFQYPAKHRFGMFRFLHSSAHMHHNGIYFPLTQANQYLWKAQQISGQFVNIL